MAGRVDWHVHIGRFDDADYTGERVFAALKAGGTDEAWFSSSTSGTGLGTEMAGRGETGAAEAYRKIRREVMDALAAAKRMGFKAHALYWVMPEVHLAEDAPVDIARAMEETPYEGFKLHPRGNRWDLEDERTARLAEEVFAHAEAHGMPVLIHCGRDDFELPTKFEAFVARHPGATVQLAHCRPLQETLYMLRKYPNTVCDTSFAAKPAQVIIRASGYGERMRFGTDFPATHWFANRENPPRGEVAAEDLAEYARRTCGGGWDDE